MEENKAPELVPFEENKDAVKNKITLLYEPKPNVEFTTEDGRKHEIRFSGIDDKTIRCEITTYSTE